MSIYERFSPAELAILRERANRAATLAEAVKAEVTLPILIVKLQTEAYALPVDLIESVYERVAVVLVPCVPAFVAGIANVRGQILPVINLAAVLSLPESPLPDRQTLVVAGNERMIVALTVDALGEAMTVRASELAPLPPNLAVAHAEYVQGLLPDGTALLDLQAILDDPALIVDGATN